MRILLAVAALAPKPAPPGVALDHLHAARVSLREQAATVAAALRGHGAMTFFDLAGDEATPPIVVARFLAVLELYRSREVALDQPEAFAELHVRWAPGEADAGSASVTGDDG